MTTQFQSTTAFVVASKAQLYLQSRAHVKSVQIITGKTETFLVETARHEELGDTVFIEMMDDQGVTRMALPPRVANAIAAQRDSLTTRRRSRAAKALTQAKERTRRSSGVYEGEEMKKDAERLEWIANDYLHLAQDADGKVDALRRKQYRWLMRLVKKLADTAN
jgi:hypothetical protein